MRLAQCANISIHWKVPHFGAATQVVPKFTSHADPAAQWTGAHKGLAFFAYSNNYLIDTDNAIIVDVEASRAVRPGRDRRGQKDDRSNT